MRIGVWTPARGTAFTLLAFVASSTGADGEHVPAQAAVPTENQLLDPTQSDRVVALAATDPVTATSFATPAKPSRVLPMASAPAPAVAAAPAPTETAVPAEAPPEPAPASDPPQEPEPVFLPAPSGSVEDAIAAWFPDLYDEAYEVVLCESTLNPDAVSPGGGNHGLFQINTVHIELFGSVTGVAFYDGVYDPYLNAQFARYLYDNSGWGPWACSP